MPDSHQKPRSQKDPHELDRLLATTTPGTLPLPAPLPPSSPQAALGVREALRCFDENLTRFGGGAPLIEARFTEAEVALIRSALRAAPVAQGGEATDTARLDWLEAGGIGGFYLSTKYVGEYHVRQTGKDEVFSGPTLRSAIDAAMRPTPPKATEGIIHCKGDGSLSSDNA